jgi:hypothetical protein
MQPQLKRDHLSNFNITYVDMSDDANIPLDPNLTPQQILRAKAIRELHAHLGHPGDKSLIHALDNNLITNTILTGQDVRNANQLLGPCPCCIQGKMRAPPERPSDTPPVTNIGEIIHVDLLPIPTTIGGFNSPRQR